MADNHARAHNMAQRYRHTDCPTATAGQPASQQRLANPTWSDGSARARRLPEACAALAPTAPCH